MEIAVRAVEFSPDGEQIISAGWDGAIKFLCRSNGAVARTIVAHTGVVYALSLSSDGRMLASGGADRMLNLWRVADGTLLRSINAHTSAVYSVALSPDASLVISGGGPDNQLKIWRTADGELLRSIQGSWGSSQDNPLGGMWSVAFAPNGEYIAGSALEIWTVDGTQFRNFGEVEARTHVKFSPDSTRVFATVPYGMIGHIILERTQFLPWSTAFYPATAISPDGRSVISTGFGDPNFVWAVFPRQTNQFCGPCTEIKAYTCVDGECALQFASLAFDPLMRTVAAGAVTGEVVLFKLPIWLSNIAQNGSRVDLHWQGGSGNYQLQKLAVDHTWQDLGVPLSNNTASVSMDVPSLILRVKNVVP